MDRGLEAENIGKMIHDLPLDWQKIGNINFRLQNMCELYWEQEITGTDQYSDFEIEYTHVSVARNGGPIALMNKQRNILTSNTHLLKKNVAFFNGSGKLISIIPWGENSEIACFQFNEDEQLVILTEEGNIYVISPKDENVEFRMLQSFQENKIEIGKLIGNTMVIVTTTKSVYIVEEILHPQLSLLYQNLMDSFIDKIDDFIVISQKQSSSGQIEAIFAHETRGIYRLQEDRVMEIQQKVGEKEIVIGKVVKMGLNPSGKMMAFYTEDLSIVISSTNFTRSGKVQTLLEEPKELIWCGDDTVVLVYEDKISVVGNNQQSEDFYIDSRKGFFPLQELDGIRIITNTISYFFHHVPKCTEGAFIFGSLQPAAFLLTAYQKFQQNDPSTEEEIRIMKEEGDSSSLKEGIDACVEAATYEFDTRIQKFLLKAASFGRHFLEDYEFDPNQFVRTLKILRIINQARMANYGRMITYQQYKKIKAKEFVRLLLKYHHHFLAFEICQYLDLKDISMVYEDWAISKIKYTSIVDEHQLFQEINAKLLTCPGKLSYKRIAQAADLVDKKNITLKLLAKEKSIKETIPFLLGMREYKKVLEIAINFGDTDIINGVFREIRNNIPDVGDILSYCLEVDNSLRFLLGFAHQLKELNPEDHFLEAIFENIRRSSRIQDPAFHTKMRILGIPHTEMLCRVEEMLHFEHIDDQMRKVERIGESLMDPMYKSILDEYIHFNKFKREFVLKDKKKVMALGEDFMRKESIHDTLKFLIKNNNLKSAQEFAKKFKIPEKHFWIIRLNCLVDKGDWGGVENMGAEKKKPPIPWKCFANACIENGRQDLAPGFIRRIPDLREQIDLFIGIGQWRDAVDTVAGKKEGDHLDYIIERTSIPSSTFEGYLEQSRARNARGKN